MKRRPSRKCIFLLLLFSQVFILIFVVAYGITYPYHSINYIRLLFGYKYQSSEQNYFLDIESRKNIGLVVDMPNCKIPKIPSRDVKIQHLFRKAWDGNYCDGENRHWTFVNGSNLVLNEANIKESRYKLDEISCCYKTIVRISESVNDYSKEASNRVGITGSCTVLKQTSTEMTNEFVRVTCGTQKSPNLYEKFHALAIPTKDSKTQEKIKFWSENKNLDKPPNILVIGIDSTSRQSFARNLAKTRKILEKIGAIEFFGYTKVGDNTFPAIVPFLSGYSTSDLEKICYHNQWTLQDYCPYIWREFDKLNYFTALVEDIPKISTFTYKKTGFVKQPTDFYYRTFKLGVDKFKTFENKMLCIGYEKLVDNMVNYIEDLSKMSEKSQVPLYLHFWIDTLTHDNYNGAQLGDKTFSKFLEFSQNLKNTIVIFLSDHGYRYGKIRNTLPGWYEDKLPYLWFKISQDLQIKYPQWSENLRRNSKKLTTAYDMYHTMVDILKISSNLQIQNAQTPNGQTILRKFGQSLISSEISELRTCSDAGIPRPYCPCSVPQPVPLDDPHLIKAGEQAVDFINSFIPKSLCVDLFFKYNYAGAVLKNDSHSTEYTVGFVAGPTEIFFQTNVQYFKENDSYTVSSEIGRTSLSNSMSGCVDHYYIELYCFCK